MTEIDQELRRKLAVTADLANNNLLSDGHNSEIAEVVERATAKLVELAEENTKLRKILAHVPAAVAIAAKEAAGFPDYVGTSLSDDADQKFVAKYWGDSPSWVTDRIMEVLQYGTEVTGLDDLEGNPISVGDLVRCYYNEYYGDITRLVFWNKEDGAYCMIAYFKNGAGFVSLNARDVRKGRKVGTIWKNPTKFVAAKRIK